MKRAFPIIFAAALLAACGNKEVSTPKELNEVFEKPKGRDGPTATPPQVQTLVDQAVTALKNHDDSTAVVSLQALRTDASQLTVDQYLAVQNMMAQAQRRLAERAAAGDPQAKAAMEMMKYKRR